MDNKPGKRNWRPILGWVAFFILFLMITGILREQVMEEDMPYSRFRQSLKERKVDEIVIGPEHIRGVHLVEGKRVRFRTFRIDDTKLVEELEYAKINYKGEPESRWWMFFIQFGPVLLFVLFWWFLLVRQVNVGGKQVLSFGRSRAKLYAEKKTKVTFKDVAGVEEAKEELQEIIEFLKDPGKFQRLGGRIPKGVLLYGAPGTGKTLLAKAVAGEAGVPFFSSSGSEFVEMFVGVGASRVRDLFEQGKRHAPCLLFVDELDAVGRYRFAGIGGGHDEREQTLNQLLVELDGFDSREGVILIAATNRPDVLDPALLRPGRFDRNIGVSVPDLHGREDILKVHAKNVKLAEKIDLSIISRRTPGFVGADLANLINEAALLAARKSKNYVEMADLEEAIDRVMAGPERKSRFISDQEKRIISFHEAGHTLIAKLIPGSDPVHKVSIMPRGPALGYTLQLPLEDRYLTTRSEIVNRVTVLLGGRCAEELVFKDVTTGAQNDLTKATEMITKMVCEYGMSARLGPLTFRKKEGEVFLGRDIMRDREYSEKTAQLIDDEIKKIVDSCLAQARRLLEENQRKLERLAEKLIEKEILVGEEIDTLLNTELPVTENKPNRTKKSKDTLPESTETITPTLATQPSPPAPAPAPSQPVPQPTQVELNFPGTNSTEKTSTPPAAETDGTKKNQS